MTPAARERRQVEAPVLFITMAAWIVILLKPGGSGLSGSCCVPASLGAALSSGSLRMLMLHNPLSSLAQGWALMLVAMMAPMLAAPVRHVLDRSFARRRAGAVLLFVMGYTAMWMAAGALILAVALAIRLFMPASFLPVAVGTVLALAWQCSPAKQRCLNRGHAHSELAAFGAAANLGVLRFGLAHGFWCIGSCWALMLLSELFPVGHIAAMAVVTVWLLAEKLERPMPPRWCLRATPKAARIAIAQMRGLLQGRKRLIPWPAWSQGT